MRFTWDPAKASANARKHGVTFGEAASVLADALSTTFRDESHSDSERRLVTVGMSAEHRLLVVAHTEFEDTIRIISARRATRRERHFYEQTES